MPDTTAAKRRFPNRESDKAKEKPGAAKSARDSGPHGAITHADGSSQAAKNNHKAPLKGEPGLDVVKKKS